MPIVDVELVAGTNGAVATGLAQSLADAVGRILKSPQGQTWVRVHLLAREHYAENESSVEQAELPVFVTVLKRVFPAKEELAEEISAMTSAIAQVLGCPVSRVHIEYAPAAAVGFPSVASSL